MTRRLFTRSVCNQSVVVVVVVVVLLLLVVVVCEVSKNRRAPIMHTSYSQGVHVDLIADGSRSPAPRLPSA